MSTKKKMTAGSTLVETVLVPVIKKLVADVNAAADRRDALRKTKERFDAIKKARAEKA